MEPLCSYTPVAGPSFVASMPSRASWLQARVRNAVTEYRRGPWLTWPHRSIISRYAAGHSSLYRCSTMPCSSHGSPGDRQRKTSSYTPSLAPIPPPRVLEEILWRRRSGIGLGTPLATSPQAVALEQVDALDLRRAPTQGMAGGHGLQYRGCTTKLTIGRKERRGAG